MFLKKFLREIRKTVSENINKLSIMSVYIGLVTSLSIMLFSNKLNTSLGFESFLFEILDFVLRTISFAAILSTSLIALNLAVLILLGMIKGITKE